MQKSAPSGRTLSDSGERIRARKLRRRERVWTDQDDEEKEYDRLYVHDATDPLEEEQRIRPQSPIQEIWPHWSEGVPAKFRQRVFSPRFHSKGDVRHKARPYFKTVEFKWNARYMLSQLEANSGLLPGKYSGEWSG